MSDYVDTGELFTTAISTLQKLLEQHQTEIEVERIWNYDNLMIDITPSIAIVFDNAKPIQKTLSRECCNLMIVNGYIYMYLESLELGSDTYQHISRLGRLTGILYDHNDLYNLCHSEHMDINSSILTGRRVQNDIMLTGQVEFSIPMRFTRDSV